MQSKREPNHVGLPSDRKRKRTGKLALAACSRCRHLKRRCDSARPSCASCQKTDAVCEYETVNSTESRPQAMKRQYEDIQTSHELVRDSIDWLRTQDQEAALSCLKRLKYSVDPMNELCSIASTERSTRLPIPMPPEQLLPAMSSSLNSLLDVELSLTHPSTFPLLFENSLDFPTGTLSQPNPAFDPKDTDVLWPPTLAAEFDQEHRPQTVFGGSPPIVPKPQDIEQDSNYRLIDDRLRNVKIRYWTTVAIPDHLAAELLSRFVEIEIPVYGFFEPETFIEDLVSQNTRFCSSLLVNAILFWASCTFGPLYPAASRLSNTFLSSAQRLLEADQTSQTDLTVASLAILSISMICFGNDEMAKQYMAMCIRMGEEMHLFGKERYSSDQIGSLPTKEADMLSYVAWGAFNVSTVYALHFHDLSSGTFTKFPPLLPRPGSQQKQKEGFTQDQACSVPRYLGASFPFFCQFWCIAHDMAAVYYSAPGPIHEHVPMAFAETKFRSLLKWSDELPAECSRQEVMSHNVAEMHICYHATIMDVFRPFLSQSQLLSTFASDPQRPIAIFALSFNHLKELTKYYHTTFANTAAAHSISWVHGPLYIAPTILRYDKSEKGASEFLACMNACAPLIESHLVMDGAVKALFSVAVSAGVFDVRQAMAHINALTAKRATERVFLETKTGFVIDQDLAMESRDPAVGDSLIQKFDEMAIFDVVSVPE